MLATTLVYLWVDLSQNGFNLDPAYKASIEHCSGEPLELWDIKNQNFFTCGAIIIGFAALSGFAYRAQNTDLTVKFVDPSDSNACKKFIY